MANIEDYLDWRSDIPFSVDPFNEVDNLILSELVYTPFDGIVEGPSKKNKITIEEACEKFFSLYSDEEILARTANTKVAPFLMRKMINTKRYKGMKLAAFVNELDAETQTQFAAISYYLPDNTIYVAFRGTDDSLIGWREDFSMCFSKGTGGQVRAIKYLNDNFSRTIKKIRVGGHSKGGNFAVYSSAFCKQSVQKNIIEVYSNDSPGFVEEIIKKDEYKAIVKKVISTIPSSSIVGMLMYHKFKSKVICSTGKGIQQHDPMTWQVSRNRFEEADCLDELSVQIDNTIKSWAEDFDYEIRDIFGEMLFSSLESSGVTKLSEVTGAKLASVANIRKSINTLDKEKQIIFYDILKKLAAKSGDTVINSIVEKMPSITKSEKTREKNKII